MEISRPSTKAEALERGLRSYVSGMPCKNGHIAPRSISDDKCNKCKQDRVAAARKLDPTFGRNPEKRRVWQREAYANNPDRTKAHIKKFHKKRPEVRRILNMGRRARKLDAVGIYTSSDIQELLDRQGGLCANPYCVKNIIDCYTIDHKTPLIRDGSNWPRNLQLRYVPRVTAVNGLKPSRNGYGRYDASTE